MAEFKYEITERIAVLSQSANGWERQLNMVSWNGREPNHTDITSLLVAGGAWYVTDGLGGESAGPPVLFALAAAGAVALFVVARRRPVTPSDV